MINNESMFQVQTDSFPLLEGVGGNLWGRVGLWTVGIRVGLRAKKCGDEGLLGRSRRSRGHAKFRRSVVRRRLFSPAGKVSMVLEA